MNAGEPGGPTIRRVAGHDVHVHDVSPSTNDEAARLARQGAPHGLVVWAKSQTAGRGRRGRQWVSERGGLYASLIVRPAVTPARAAELSFLTGLAIAEAADTLLPTSRRARCKWPNDVMVDGAKLAGVLLESEAGPDGGLAWLVIGFGVNVADHPEGVELPATSLNAAAPSEESRVAATVADALAAVLTRFDDLYAQWLEEGFPPIRARWLSRAAGLGGTVRVRLAREEVTGVFRDLDVDGTLLLDVGRDDIRRVTAGDVFLT